MEKFDFKSLARECSSAAAAAGSGSTTNGYIHHHGNTDILKHNNNNAAAADLLKHSGDVNMNMKNVIQNAASVLDAKPPLSRLDIRERLIAASEGEGEDECGLEEEEEERLERLTVVSNTVPGDLKLSPGKLALLGTLGMTTRKRRKGLFWIFFLF